MTPRGITSAGALALALVACSGSAHAPTTFGAAPQGPAALVYLDTELRVTFETGVDLDPATAVSPAVQLYATDGPGAGTHARGTWRVDGNVLAFTPDLPRGEPVLTSGGMLPDTIYALHLAGGQTPQPLACRDGRRLQTPVLFTVRTRAGFRAGHLFEHNAAGGPTFTGCEATPKDAAGNWRLGRSSDDAVLRLSFDQPLDPSGDNLPAQPTAAARGPFWLVYDDPEHGQDTWLPIDVELERNTTAGATVALRPRGVLPSAAELRLWLGPGLRDLFGETLAPSTGQLAATIATETAYAPQFDAIVLDFARDPLDSPDFGELPAIVENGALRVPDTFPAVAGVGTFVPTGVDTVLRTDVQTLHYVDAAPRTFEGGVLHMRDLHLLEGQILRGFGPNPLVLVVDGDARIDGLLTVSGTNADQHAFGQFRGPGDVSPPRPGSTGLTSGSTSPTNGPIGGPGGGAGGAHPRFGVLGDEAPGQAAPGTTGGGGATGPVGCAPCSRSAGGGGGAMATAGDPWFPTAAGPGSAFVQRSGQGGFGCAGAAGALTRSLAGAAAGAPLFRDSDPRNDFWGSGYDPRLARRIAGELPGPRGGAGGGAGGNHNATTCDPEATLNSVGGSGGGGGGVVVLQVRGTLVIGPRGRIEANGGHGFRAPLYDDSMGGGGGGAGGMVVLMAGRGLVLHTHGGTFADQDYDFAISADGGICRHPTNYTPVLIDKYPASGQPTVPAFSYDQGPAGGLGGLGVIQLMVPVGQRNDDLTNTVLDDAITILQNGQPLQGADKQRFLGWRGLPDETGHLVDDFGMPTGTIGGQGDLRPDPILLPAPFVENGRARARSGWQPLGARLRRALAAPDGQPRAVLGEPLCFGNPARSDGWLPWADGHLDPHHNGTALLAEPAPIAECLAEDPTLGRALAAVRVAGPLPQPERDAYAGCVAELSMPSGGSLVRLRVVGSDGDLLFFAFGTPLPAQATRLQLHAAHVELDGQEPEPYLGADLAWRPRSNARLGFAFHRAPELAGTPAGAGERFPPQPGSFLHDLEDPAVTAALRAFRPTHVQWDVLLEGEFRTSAGDEPPAGNPAATVSLRRLWLPVRF